MINGTNTNTTEPEQTTSTEVRLTAAVPDLCDGCPHKGKECRQDLDPKQPCYTLERLIEKGNKQYGGKF